MPLILKQSKLTPVKARGQGARYCEVSRCWRMKDHLGECFVSARKAPQAPKIKKARK